MTRILVTGIGGFIGAHVLDHLLTTTDWEIVGLDSFRHKGLSERITSSLRYQEHRRRVTILTHDLRAPISDRLGSHLRAEYILNLASESHVDRSITDPVPFVENNVSLVLNLLEHARKVPPVAFIQVSTDEVYGPMTGDRGFPEWSTILPSNPYSASKAAQEAIAIAYWRTYGVPVILTNTMNNYGEKQDPEKYLPLLVRSILAGQEVSIHGSTGDVGSRFWLHARNHADALLWILQHTIPVMFPDASRPSRYNVVGDVRMDNLTFAQRVAKTLDRPLRWCFAPNPRTRPGHDLHYGLDGSLLAGLGWKAPLDFATSLDQTIHWYERHPEWLTQ